MNYPYPHSIYTPRREPYHILPPPPSVNVNGNGEMYQRYYDSVNRYFNSVSNTRITINRIANILLNQETNMREIINQNYQILSF